MRLTNWKAKNLSLAGRCTLIQSVLAGVPSYVMQTAWLPQSTCDALNQLKNFLWGSIADRRRLHLVKWSTVSKPKSQGGLGLHDARTANIALLAKVGGQLVNGNDKVWAKVLNAKYVKSQQVLQVLPKTGDSVS